MLRPYLTEDRIEAGCDEAGRGCLAGPVVAAAVILPKDYRNPLLNDSKQLTEKLRYSLRPQILNDALAWSVAFCTSEEIDRMNILKASITAMQRAVSFLSVRPELLLIDGNRFYNYEDIPHKCIVKGDATFASIAAASVLAKTYRDDLMKHLDGEYPQYGWAINKGYPTAAHRRAIAELGLSPLHRTTFRCREDDGQGSLF